MHHKNTFVHILKFCFAKTDLFLFFFIANQLILFKTNLGLSKQSAVFKDENTRFFQSFFSYFKNLKNPFSDFN